MTTEQPEVLRVLVVDDEKLIADTLTLILNRSGFNTTAAYSGETAVETAKVLKPHVLISDVVMGKMTGIEAASQIRRSVPDCRVILFSGQAATLDLEPHSANRNRFEILMKPVRPQDFILRLSQLAYGARHNNGCAYTTLHMQPEALVRSAHHQ